MAHIISISNQKGGVGKTTTAINLAACLGAGGYRTLVVDMDPQGNATRALGIDPHVPESTIYHALIEFDADSEEPTAPPSPIDLSEQFAGLHLLPSNEDLAGAEFELQHVEEGRDTRLRSILEPLRDNFDYIVIDSPPSFSLLTINVLTAADFVIIPVQAEYLALEGLAHITRLVDRIKGHQNPDLETLGILVTLYDHRTRLAKEVWRELDRTFEDQVFKTRVARSIRLSEAPSHGLPIIYYDINSPGAEAYVRLCQEVINGIEKITRSRTGS